MELSGGSIPLHMTAHSIPPNGSMLINLQLWNNNHPSALSRIWKILKMNAFVTLLLKRGQIIHNTRRQNFRFHISAHPRCIIYIYISQRIPIGLDPSWSHLSRWLNHEVPSEGPTRPQSPQKAKNHENVGISEYIEGLTDHLWDFIGESWHPNPTPVLQLFANHFHFLHTWLRWFHIVRKPNTAGPWDMLAFWKFAPQFLQRKWYHHLISFQSSSWNGWSMGCPSYPTHLPNEWFRGQ